MTPAPHLVPPTPAAPPAAAEAPAPLPGFLPAARLLAHASAWLVLLGLLTGAYVGAAMTGKVPADGHMALASHLNALMGGFLMLGVAWTLPMLRYGATGQRRLAWAFILANFANWFVTGVKAWLRVSGIDAIGEPVNDAVFGVLTLTVVLPSLGAAVAWVYGFRRGNA
jgi:(hydroxyamino)benzene mutase